MVSNQAKECQKPHCSETPLNTYRDSNGNKLKLCDNHYYALVSENTAVTLPNDLPDAVGVDLQ